MAVLASRGPRSDGAGGAIPDVPAPLSALERLDPARLSRDRRPGAHWDGAQWHDGSARGVALDGGWAWLLRDGPSWWALAGTPTVPLLWHDHLWWLKRDGVWFAMHDGEPWAWRSFHDWDAQGFFHPASGTEMIYSRDFTRVAVVAPGEGADVFDADSGRLLARVPEAGMPSRERPAPELPRAENPFAPP